MLALTFRWKSGKALLQEKSFSGREWDSRASPCRWHGPCCRSCYTIVLPRPWLSSQFLHISRMIIITARLRWIREIIVLRDNDDGCKNYWHVACCQGKTIYCITFWIFLLTTIQTLVYLNWGLELFTTVVSV